MSEEKKQYLENPAPERKTHVYTGPKEKVQEDGLKVKEVFVDEFVVNEAAATQEVDAASEEISELADSTDCKHDELKSCVDCPEPAGTCPLSPIAEIEELPVPVEEVVDPKLTVFNCTQVNLRNSPEYGLNVICVLSCGAELVAVESEYNNDIYVKVCTASGIEGFVQRAYVKG